jgi:Dehydrogenases with different specificities (related to short-chain alcohol dehydrogenases)
LGYLDGKVALVTGASRGIGRAVALKFAAEGAKVAVNYLTSEEEAHQVVQEIESRGGEALAVRADVARKADVVAMVERICEEWGGVDILMNNAGLALDGPAERMSEEDWDRVIDVNLKGTFLCTQAVIPSMRERGAGKVINVSAASAVRGRKDGANFCAAKAGVLALTKCFARELAPLIQVNCLMPGFTQTEEVVKRFRLDDPQVRAKLLAEIPMGRLATVEEIADGALVLASKFSDLMTGQVLAINGGSYM